MVLTCFSEQLAGNSTAVILQASTGILKTEVNVIMHCGGLEPGLPCGPLPPVVLFLLAGSGPDTDSRACSREVNLTTPKPPQVAASPDSQVLTQLA